MNERQCQHITKEPIYIKALAGMKIDPSEWENENGAFLAYSERPCFVHRRRRRKVLPAPQT